MKGVRASLGMIGAGSVLGNFGLASQSRMDLNTGAVADMFGNVGYQSRMDLNTGVVADLFGNVGLGYQSTMDLNTGVVADMFWNVGLGYQSTMDLNTGVVADMFGNVGLGYQSAIDPHIGAVADKVWNVGLAYDSTDLLLRISPLSDAVPDAYYGVKTLEAINGGGFEYGAHVGNWRRFEVLLPHRFNNGKDVPLTMLEEAKLEFLDIFGGVSRDAQEVEGLWWHGGVLFSDKLTRILIDAPDLNATRRRVKEYKERWRRRLCQIELWVTSYDVRIE
jgi:hypothetical protein